METKQLNILFLAPHQKFILHLILSKFFIWDAILVHSNIGIRNKINPKTKNKNIMQLPICPLPTFNVAYTLKCLFHENCLINASFIQNGIWWYFDEIQP